MYLYTLENQKKYISNGLLATVNIYSLSIKHKTLILLDGFTIMSSTSGTHCGGIYIHISCKLQLNRRLTD